MYPMYPPFMYGPPPRKSKKIDSKTLYYAALGKERKRHENEKIKTERKNRERAKAARERSMTSLEWFIIGVILHPIVGPLYHAAVNHIEIYSRSNP